MDKQVLIDKYFAELIKSFSESREMELKQLSNNAIESAVLAREKVLVDISIVSYALAKLMSKPHLFKTKDWERFKQDTLKELNRKRDTGKILDKIIENVNKFDISVGNYMRDVIEKSRVKQASRAYALGISLKQASELTGVNLSSLLDYIGATKIHDRPFTKSKSVMERYKTAKKALSD